MLIIRASKTKRASKWKRSKKTGMVKRPASLVLNVWEYDAEVQVYTLFVGCKSPNFKNSRKHYRVVANSIRAQREATMHALARHDIGDVIAALGGAPNSLQLTRLSPGTLDDDSLPVSMAAVRDQFCAWLAGQNTLDGKGDDGPKCGITFGYEQKKCVSHGVRMEFFRGNRFVEPSTPDQELAKMQRELEALYGRIADHVAVFGPGNALVVLDAYSEPVDSTYTFPLVVKP